MAGIAGIAGIAGVVDVAGMAGPVSTERGVWHYKYRCLRSSKLETRGDSPALGQADHATR